MPRLLDLPKPPNIQTNCWNSNAANFSDQGNEIAWGTIGNASTSEGLFLKP
jgi:hypothetical protein